MGEARRRGSGRDIDKILDKLGDWKSCGEGWSARCPAHDDDHPSLTITEADNGRPVMYCHAGCSYQDICRALDISNIVVTYDYQDEAGKLLYQVTRTMPKGFFQRRPDGKGGFINGLGDTRRVLYRLPELLKADPKHSVFIPEGEKDVDALRQLGCVATCNLGGAGKWRDEYNSELTGRDVVVLPDNDPHGEEHARSVINSLLPVAASVKLVNLPNLPEKGDVSDWLNAGGTKQQLLAFVEKSEILDSRYYTSMNRENIESGFTLFPLDELFNEPDEADTYIWDRTLPTAGFSICAAKPKVGKSTWARNLAVAVSQGTDFFGRSTTQGKVIYLALEEKLPEVKAHFRRMGSDGKQILVHKGFMPRNPIQSLELAIQNTGASLVVIDPLSRFLRVNDFNSYGEVSKALEPLIDLARNSGCHILALHHNGKGGEGTDSLLGSTAFFAAVDTLLIMRRKDNNRYLYSEQRCGDNLPEIVVHLDPQTGSVSSGGEAKVIQIHAYRTKILDTLGDDVLLEPQIKERVGGNSTDTAKALRELVDDGLVQRSGKGVKNNPYLYRKAEESSILDFPPKANLDYKTAYDQWFDVTQGEKLDPFIVAELDRLEKAGANLHDVPPIPISTAA